MATNFSQSLGDALRSVTLKHLKAPTPNFKYVTLDPTFLFSSSFFLKYLCQWMTTIFFNVSCYIHSLAKFLSCSGLSPPAHPTRLINLVPPPFHDTSTTFPSRPVGAHKYSQTLTLPEVKRSSHDEVWREAKFKFV